MELVLRTTIKTYSKNIMDYEHPQSFRVSLLDIAKSLSKQCRFNGNIEQFYSVAEHCCLLYDLTDKRKTPELAKALLIHDASETYVGDIPSPLKNILPQFRVLEDRIQDHIYRSLGIEMNPALHTNVVARDKWILTEEKVFYQGNDGSAVPFKSWKHERAFVEYSERLKEAFPQYSGDL